MPPVMSAPDVLAGPCVVIEDDSALVSELAPESSVVEPVPESVPLALRSSSQSCSGEYPVRATHSDAQLPKEVVTPNYEQGGADDEIDASACYLAAETWTIDRTASRQ